MTNAGEPTVRVRLFAVAAERAGAREIVVQAGTVGEVRAALAARAPALAALLPRCALAVDGTYATDAQPVPDGAEVAVIPPVSGGAGTDEAGPYGRIQDTPIDAGDIVARVRQDDAGALVVFHGTVRAHTGDQVTDYLEYESYVSLAQREMERILREVEAAVPGSRLAAAHRTGRLDVGETAVVVAATAGHRDGAFEAARTAIDRIKAEVPIWKREIGPDGTAWVEGSPVAGADRGGTGPA